MTISLLNKTSVPLVGWYRQAGKPNVPAGLGRCDSSAVCCSRWLKQQQRHAKPTPAPSSTRASGAVHGAHEHDLLFQPLLRVIDPAEWR